MNDKNINNIIKYYEEENIDCLTIQDYLESLVSVYQKHLEDKPLEIVIPALLKFLGKSYNPTNLGIYLAFKSKDMSLLNDVLYQSACIGHVSNILSWGGDHGYFSFHVLPEILASNSSERIEILIPENLKMCTNGHRISTAKMNLIMALYYGKPDFIEIAKKGAEDVLKTKLSIADRESISYLFALLNKQPDVASQHLNLFCAGMKMSKEYGVTRFTKAFCVEAHGLYNLVRYVQDGELDGKIEMPKEDNFSQELVMWQRNNDYPQGKIFIKYPEPLEIINTILSITPPSTSLCQQNKSGRKKNNWFVDTEKFKQLVTKEIIEKWNEK